MGGPELAPIEFDTERLRLRRWRDTDRAPFAQMNADPRVREHFPSTQTREQSDASVDFWVAGFAARGWGNWAAERKDNGEFIGFVGLWIPRTPMPVPRPADTVEIGWRLAHAHWGHGFATEAARACLRVGFERIGLERIVSWTTLANTRSRAVMQRIGLQDTGIVFEHSAIPPGHPQRPHCFYEIERQAWKEAQAGAAAQGTRAAR
jgi:RimJ/RimL family protein N-acetyltransferase